MTDTTNVDRGHNGAHRPDSVEQLDDKRAEPGTDLTDTESGCGYPPARAEFFRVSSAGLEIERPLVQALVTAGELTNRIEAWKDSGTWDGAKHQYKRSLIALEEAKAVPENSRKPRQRWIALGAKLVLILGDCAVLSGIWWRAGLPLWLAVLAGASTAITIVGSGSMLGRELEIAAQRRRRGSPPNRISTELRHLYALGNGSNSRWWIALCVILAVLTACAVTIIGVAVGDRPGMALGAGIFASLTLIGSAAAESSGTNSAADHVEACERDVRRSLSAVTEYESGVAEAGYQLELARTLERRLRYESAASALTVLAADASAANTLTPASMDLSDADLAHRYLGRSAD